MSTVEFVRQWNEGGDNFETDPPNAVLEIGESAYAIELQSPVYDVASGTLTYVVSPLDEEMSISLRARASVDEMDFGTAALFIDNRIGLSPFKCPPVCPPSPPPDDDDDDDDDDG
jgi:hypothetical protein